MMFSWTKQIRAVIRMTIPVDLHLRWKLGWTWTGGDRSGDRTNYQYLSKTLPNHLVISKQCQPGMLKCQSFNIHNVIIAYRSSVTKHITCMYAFVLAAYRYICSCAVNMHACSVMSLSTAFTLCQSVIFRQVASPYGMLTNVAPLALL